MPIMNIQISSISNMGPKKCAKMRTFVTERDIGIAFFMAELRDCIIITKGQLCHNILPLRIIRIFRNL